MQLKDYIQYYIGCQCIIDYTLPGGNKIIDYKGRFIRYDCTDESPYCVKGETDTIWLYSIKPILRKLEDMTDEDKTEIGKVMGWYKGHELVGVNHMETMHDTYKKMASDCLIRANSNFDDRLGPSAYFTMLPI